MPSPRTLVLAVVGAAVLVPAAVAGADAASSSTSPAVTYPAAHGTYTSVRPTGVGLPQIGESGTVGAGQFTDSLNDYVSSGEYEADLATVDGAAERYLNARLADERKPKRKVCTTSYRRVHVAGYGGALYRRVRTCRKRYTVPRLHGKPALVLDIDETSLSNLKGLQAAGYTSEGLDTAVVSGQDPAIVPTLDLYKDAISHHVSVFFITGRPSAIESITVSNLKSAGYDEGWAALDMEPSSEGVEAFKSSTRAAIQKQGYDILVNVGDQESDLDGGHADQAFKLPDPFYFIGDD